MGDTHTASRTNACDSTHEPADNKPGLPRLDADNTRTDNDNKVAVLRTPPEAAQLRLAVQYLLLQKLQRALSRAMR